VQGDPGRSEGLTLPRSPTSHSHQNHAIMDHTDEAVSPTTTQKENGFRLPEEPPSSRKRLTRVPTSSDDHPPSLEQSPTNTTTTAAQSMRASRHRPTVDEITPIFGNGRVNGRNYQSTDHGRGRPTSSDDGDEEFFRQRTKSQCDRACCQHHVSNNARQDEDDLDDEHCISWYKNVADKFGSLELENKGSVARDHLALGMPFLFLVYKVSTKTQINLINPNRTNFPCLASYLSGLCFYWYRRNPTLPPQQNYQPRIFYSCSSPKPSARTLPNRHCKCQ
jgi:hypothetical protein